ncbi:acyl-CoA thioesterase [Acinetobacter haemolyticus]|uniref:acyl-CoA thioesterase n=1 Tax=Acinetobacter haemolyticus TaxID=29430 RepID=UPI000D69D18A|nr:thioesterase family protein [Acinetobacter haemolyticus]
MSKPIFRTREQFKFFFNIQTRWADNDIYGHVNNVTYYSYFDTAANSLLIQKTGFDIHNSEIIGLVVDSACSFLQELSFPEMIEVGVAIGKIGNSSLRYELAIFKQNQPQTAAQGHFVHVFVDRKSRKSMAIPQEMREILNQYLLIEK